MEELKRFASVDSYVFVQRNKMPFANHPYILPLKTFERVNKKDSKQEIKNKERIAETVKNFCNKSNLTGEIIK